jgi:hypothetical protein
MKEGKILAQNLMEKTTPTLIDPLSAINIRVSIRTGSKADGLCCICGVENSPNNPIEMHHIKHIYKRKIISYYEKPSPETYTVLQANPQTNNLKARCHL